MVGRLAALPGRFLRAAPGATLPGRYGLTLLLISFWFAVFLRDNAVLLLVSGAIACVLLSALWNALATGRLRIRRRMPRRVVQGTRFPVLLQVRNESGFLPAFSLSFRDTLQKGSPGEVTCSPTVRVLPPGGSVELRYEARVHRRGIHQVTNALAATRFPFGLFEKRVLLEDPQELIVLPAFGVLGRRALRELRQSGGRQRRRRPAQPQPEELQNLREYRAGDNPRYIHWRTSARVGHLMWRVYRGEEAERLAIVLDTYVGGLHAALRRAALERAVSCAATLLAYAAKEHRRCALLLPGRKLQQVDGGRSLMPALESLAAVRESTTPAEQALRGARLGRGASALLLSLHGPAERTRKRALEHGLQVRVWDVSDPGFRRYFRLR